jgi:hypothetical protein
MGNKKPPPPTDFNQAYGQGIQTYLKYLPQLQQAEINARNVYGPGLVSGAAGLAQQADPGRYALQQQLEKQTSGDLARGTAIDPYLQAQVTDAIRARQAGSGNIMGADAAQAEALQNGQFGQQMYQQRLSNANQIASGPGLTGQDAQALGLTQNQTVNPNAGFMGNQGIQQAYQNQLAYTQASNAANPFNQILGGITGAAKLGSSFFSGGGSSLFGPPASPSAANGGIFNW